MRLAAPLALLLLVADVAQAAQEAPPPAAAGPRRRALVVGIDRYAASPRWSDLEGAVNDARDVAALLVARFGYRDEDVTVLLDGQATRQAILEAYRRVLVEPAVPGDLGVFYYAGHGSQVRNLKSTERDQLDETIVPADGQDIRDVELGRLAEAAADKGLRLTVVLDSCHSGSATRGLVASDRVRSATPDTEHGVSDDRPRPEPARKGVLVLAAARPEQLAGEARRGDRPHGAFTAALLETLASSAEGATAEAIHLRTHALLKAVRPAQDPLLEGAPERRGAPPFTPSLGGAAGRPMVAVGAVRGQEVELLGGAAMGLAEGATLVRPAGARAKVRLTVTRVLGFGRSLAGVAAPSDGDLATVSVGDLVEVERLALVAPEPLRVHVGDTLPLARVLAAARALAPLRASQALHLVADPLQVDPTHVLSWRGGAWVLRGPDGAERALGPSLDVAGLARRLAGQGVKGAAGPCALRACLFVRLPVPQELAAALPWEAVPTSPIVAVGEAAAADYLLAGRPGAAGPEYALLRRGATAGEGPCSADFQLPIRSAWFPAAGAVPGAAAAIDEAALRIGRVHAWLTLRAPQDDDAYPWRLELTSGGRAIEGAAVAPGAKIDLALVRGGPGADQRFPYVFAIDCKGAIDVAWPEPGREPDRLPGNTAGQQDRLSLGTVQLDETRGRYTFLLVASDEQLPSVEAIVQPAVTRGPPPAGTAVSELLVGLGRTRALARSPRRFTLQRVGFVAAP